MAARHCGCGPRTPRRRNEFFGKPALANSRFTLD
jgi:hypothetical protein